MLSPTLPDDKGLDLRDWFAGQTLSLLDPAVCLDSAREAGTPAPEFIAALAYALADAMLSERAKSEATL